ncbi:MAG: hypothetical protein Q8908_07130 [Bacteroidota bacterium]|nr:hypothetical protein [Bacteroidota bacterium]
MKTNALLVLLLFLIPNLFAQECKVLKTEISMSYQGDCKNGLAHGKGVARGQDSYEGEFRKGLPDGTGTYVWATGAMYKGEWRRGLRDGKGTYVWHSMNGDSTLVGVWHQDKYEGTGILPYRIGRVESIPRYTVMKGLASENKVTVRFYRGGAVLSSMHDLSVTTSSGVQELQESYLEIRNAAFPVDIRLTFVVPTLLSSNEYSCEFNVTINEPAAWDITLNL